MNPENPRSLDVGNVKIKIKEAKTTKIEDYDSILAIRNRYLLLELAAQKKVISQLIRLLSSSRQLAKPNGGHYCSHGHSFCRIDHGRFNYVNESNDCWWNSSLSGGDVKYSKGKDHTTNMKFKNVTKVENVKPKGYGVMKDADFIKKLLRQADRSQYVVGLPPTKNLDEVPNFLPPEFAALWSNIYGIFHKEILPSKNELNLRKPERRQATFKLRSVPILYYPRVKKPKLSKFSKLHAAEAKVDQADCSSVTCSSCSSSQNGYDAEVSSSDCESSSSINLEIDANHNELVGNGLLEQNMENDHEQMDAMKCSETCPNFRDSNSYEANGYMVAEEADDGHSALDSGEADDGFYVVPEADASCIGLEAECCSVVDEADVSSMVDDGYIVLAPGKPDGCSEVLEADLSFHSGHDVAMSSGIGVIFHDSCPSPGGDNSATALDDDFEHACIDFEEAYCYDDFEAMECYEEEAAYAWEEAAGYFYKSGEEFW